MTNTKSTKRALLVSVMAMVICFTMLLGTTFAWFTDSETSTNNTITAGTLQIGFDYKLGTESDFHTADGVTMFNHINWEPGYVEYRHLQISEEGSLSFNYKLRLVKDGTPSALADVIDVYLINGTVDMTAAGARTTHLVDTNKKGTLTQVLAMDNILTGNINDGGAAQTFTIVLKMQETAGNTYQGMELDATFSVQVLAAQKSQEVDNIGNDYDNGATYKDGTPSNP